MTHEYTVDDYSVTIDTSRYLADFRDEKKFLDFCRQCRNYGTCWACPPFDSDWTPIISAFKRVSLFATRILPADRSLPLSSAGIFIRPERMRIEERLRCMEQATVGRAFAFAGTCLYCPEGTCARKYGKPCRHPELVRPSLEAVGFDIGKTTKELFGIPLKWSTDGRIPEYLTLVCGLFHNDADLCL